MIISPTRFAIRVMRRLLSGIDVSTAKVYTGIADHKKMESEEFVNITVGVFFDGTLNNRENIRSKQEYEKKQNGEDHDADSAAAYTNFFGFKRSGSYDNGYSNISNMEPAYKTKSGKEIQFHLYIEGAGTEDGESDDLEGKALGSGIAGIKGKVKKACKAIAHQIEKSVKGKTILNLQIDSYGFSRGAASARNFVSEILQKKDDEKETLIDNVYMKAGQKYTADGGALGEFLASAGLTPRNKIKSRFVGLYDTVASFGIIHRNDTAELNLTAISNSAYTFQIAAGNEHRSNFRLTNINSAGRGTEKTIPGVHSDIGGGYVDGQTEDIRLDYSLYSLRNLWRERQRLIDAGWYLESEIHVNEFLGTLVGIRENLSNHYSRIPLHVMVQFSLDKNILFEQFDIESTYPIENESGTRVKLTDVRDRIYDYVFNDGKPLTMGNDEVMIKALRNKYFHFSSHYSTIGMHPNRIGNARVRVIQAG